MLDLKTVLSGVAIWADALGPLKKGEKRKCQVVRVSDGQAAEIAVLNKAERHGKLSVGLRFTLPTGEVVILELDARQFCQAGEAIKSHHPDVFM